MELVKRILFIAALLATVLHALFSTVIIMLLMWAVLYYQFEQIWTPLRGITTFILSLFLSILLDNVINGIKTRRRNTKHDAEQKKQLDALLEKFDPAEFDVQIAQPDMGNQTYIRIMYGNEILEEGTREALISKQGLYYFLTESQSTKGVQNKK
jgi:membrane protein implicated in regulation of membrane protease activity